MKHHDRRGPRLRARLGLSPHPHPFPPGPPISGAFSVSRRGSAESRICGGVAEKAIKQNWAKILTSLSSHLGHHLWSPLHLTSEFSKATWKEQLRMAAGGPAGVSRRRPRRPPAQPQPGEKFWVHAPPPQHASPPPQFWGSSTCPTHTWGAGRQGERFEMKSRGR